MQTNEYSETFEKDLPVKKKETKNYSLNATCPT